MKSLLSCFAAGVVSAFLSSSASAQDSGTLLIAPQLSIAGQGPVSATFLGSSEPFAQMYFAWGSSAVGFFFGPGTAAGATFQESPQQSPTSPFAAGTEVTFSTLFGTPETSTAVLSATGAAPSVVSLLTTPFMSEPAPGMTFNAGVFDGGAGRVLIGFNPAGSPLPSSFGGFAVRIAVSNICVN